MFRQEARSFSPTEDEELPTVVQELHHPLLTLLGIFGDVHAGRPHDRNRVSLPHTRPAREIRSKRHLRTILSYVPNPGRLGYGRFSNICNESAN